MKQKIQSKPLKHRKLNRLPGYNYSRNGWYFVTICTKDRREWFGKIQDQKMMLNKIGNIVEKCFLEIPEHFPNARLDKYIVMPNHIHGIIVIENNVGNNGIVGNDGIVGNKNFCSLQKNKIQWQKKWSRSLSSIVRGFKTGVIKWCRQNGFHDFAWQKSFHDHIIHNGKSLNNIRQYIINNQLKWEVDENNPNNLK